MCVQCSCVSLLVSQGIEYLHLLVSSEDIKFAEDFFEFTREKKAKAKAMMKDGKCTANGTLFYIVSSSKCAPCRELFECVAQRSSYLLHFNAHNLQFFWLHRKDENMTVRIPVRYEEHGFFLSHASTSCSEYRH